MSKASRGDPFLAEMKEGAEVDAVFKGRAEGKVSEDLPEGLETLRSAYQEFWTETHRPDQTTASVDSSSAKSTSTVEPGPASNKEFEEAREDRALAFKLPFLKPRRTSKAKARRSGRRTRQRTVRGSSRLADATTVHRAGRPARQRFGLPEGFVTRLQRFGRGVLLELNIYRLPNGQEFIPCLPTGPLGSRHLYALLTSEQHIHDSRGSVYVRGDGKIFDYSVVSSNPLGDMFDTGYTIYDLERTGRYAPNRESTRQVDHSAGRSKRRTKQKLQPKKSRRVAGAG